MNFLKLTVLLSLALNFVACMEEDCESDVDCTDYPLDYCHRSGFCKKRPPQFLEDKYECDSDVDCEDYHYCTAYGKC